MSDGRPYIGIRYMPSPLAANFFEKAIPDGRR